jgi:hypothetical protein
MGDLGRKERKKKQEQKRNKKDMPRSIQATPTTPTAKTVGSLEDAINLLGNGEFTRMINLGNGFYRVLV